MDTVNPGKSCLFALETLSFHSLSPRPLFQSMLCTGQSPFPSSGESDEELRDDYIVKSCIEEPECDVPGLYPLKFPQRSYFDKVELARCARSSTVNDDFLSI